MTAAPMRERRFKSPWHIAVYIVAAVMLVLWTLGPIAWSFLISITPQRETMASPANLLPQDPTFLNYARLLGGGDQLGSQFVTSLLNTLVAAIGTVVIGLPIYFLGAYALSRLRFRGRSVVNLALLATLVIPAMATVIPLFRIFVDLGLIDTHIGLIVVYVSACLPLVVWLLSSFFSTIPKEIEEAAAIDGCGAFGTLLRIVLPLSYPTLLASALIIFIGVWNQFLIPLILAPSYSTKPVAVVISEFVTKTKTDYGLMNAGGLLAIVIPCLIAVIFRKFLAYGLTEGATKG